MSLLRTLRPLTRAARPTTTTTLLRRQPFHATAATAIKVGDPLPDLAVLHEGSPGNKVNLAEEAAKSNKMIIMGVPGAFSPACSAKHVPSFMGHEKTKEFDSVVVLGVNDAFVMKAWGEYVDPSGDMGFRFLADPEGKYTRALDLDFDATPVFGNTRSKRYTILVEEGRVKSIHVEPDNTGTNVSLAENVFKSA